VVEVERNWTVQKEAQGLPGWMVVGACAVRSFLFSALAQQLPKRSNPSREFPFLAASLILRSFLHASWLFPSFASAFQSHGKATHSYCDKRRIQNDFVILM